MSAHVGLQADRGQPVEGDILGFATAHALALDQPEGHVLPNQQGIEQRRILEQHAELASDLLEALSAEADDFFAIDLNGALFGLQ